MKRLLIQLCISCDHTYTVQPRRNPGLIGQCYECGTTEERRRNVQHHLGNIGGAGINKSNAIEVVRTHDAKVRRWVKNSNKGKWWRNM